jgi:hypothetical protein
MTTIAVTPIGRQPDSTSEIIQLQIHVSEAEVFELYDRIEVWKSCDLASGPYEELTAVDTRGARLPQDAEDPPSGLVAGRMAMLVGKDLILEVDGVQLAIVFSGTDPLHYGTAALQVTAQGQARVIAYVTTTGVFVLQSTTLGRYARLQVLGGEAAAILGLPSYLAHGLEARLVLLEGTDRYTFVDPWGSKEHFYKVRFRNSSTGATSEFSQCFPGTKRLGLEPERLARGIIALVTVTGEPLINQKVQVHLEPVGTLIDEKLVAGSDQIGMTNEEGRCEFLLPRGLKVSVSVAGTGIFRTITVPDRDTFHLLDPDIADEDIFKVRVPELVMAERRTL